MVDFRWAGENVKPVTIRRELHGNYLDAPACSDYESRTVYRGLIQTDSEARRRPDAREAIRAES